VKISPKRSPKSILEEGQASRECHVKQAVPNSKDRECHTKKTDQEDRKVARAACATTAGWARPCHLCSCCTAVPLLCAGVAQHLKSEFLCLFRG